KYSRDRSVLLSAADEELPGNQPGRSMRASVHLPRAPSGNAAFPGMPFFCHGVPSQIFTVPSQAAARYWPSGLNTKALTGLRASPRTVRSSSPLPRSHTLTVLSVLPETRRFSLGLKVTQLTLSLCPRSVWSSRPVVASHTLTVL